MAWGRLCSVQGENTVPAWKPGECPNPAGRPKGSQNKLTVAVKEALQAAFDGVGGAEYLKWVARNEPKAFCMLLGKALPKDIEITGADGEPLRIQVISGVPKPEEKNPDADPSS